jgi:Zn-finger nucleic acid-binding protein
MLYYFPPDFGWHWQSNQGSNFFFASSFALFASSRRIRLWMFDGMISSMTDIDPITTEPRNLKCPKCAAAMETVAFHDIHVDRCTACRGLWFDALEKDHLDELEDSASIDIGQPGADSATVVKMNCPVCHTRMIEMVDQKAPTIHFESCKVCYGLFFDAGKYREHKEHQTVGFFRDLFHRKPK